PEPKQIFEEYYDELLRSAHDDNIALGLFRSVTAYRERKARAMERFPHTVKLAEEVRQLKEDCVTRLDELVEKASTILEENGAKVHYGETADDALKLIGEIVGSAKIIVSGKTLTGEEIGLRHHLEGLGNEFWETDCAQLIQQLREERPMHYVYPSLHVTREQVAEVLTNLLGREIPPDIPTEIRTIREFLRSKYFIADVGVSGCNVMGADTGSIFLLESEGNIRMSTTVPPVHIALVGIEKVVPTLHDAFKVAEVTWRYAGFTIPLYVSLISGPSGTTDIELSLIRGSSGPVELHVIFLDNGRSTLAKDPVLKEALYCIKCGACLLECPVFQLAAGYYGGHGYFGGLGAILTAYMGGGFDMAAPIAYTCLRCGRCTEICPLSIDLSKLIPELRRRIVNMAKR
ncbi:MAG: LUD domain-containing protein, partial [Dehalococcoidales bacterium]